MKSFVWSAAMCLLAASGLAAQSAPASPTFDVASIKPTAPETRGTFLNFQPPNGLKVSNAPLLMLITFAYDVREFQVTGGPGWVQSDRYDLLAKAEGTGGKDDGPSDFRKMSDPQRETKVKEMRERVRALLADRFQLTVHRETKEGSVYALVVAKNGSKLEEGKEGADGSQGLRGGRGELTGMLAPMQMVVNFLSGQLGRPIVDKTELKGKYNFKLKWAPDMGMGGNEMERKNPGGEGPTASTPDGPTLFTALQEQLGLKLESQKGPIEMIVIDRVEKPSEN
jgi:uncharacterized protein (TIGR03435 family)